MLSQKTKALLDGNLVDVEVINLKLHAFSGSTRYPQAIDHRPYLDDSCLVCHKFFHGDRRYSEIESCWRAGHFDLMSYMTIDKKEYQVPLSRCCSCPAYMSGHYAHCRFRFKLPQSAPRFCNHCIGTSNHSRGCPAWR